MKNFVLHRSRVVAFSLLGLYIFLIVAGQGLQMASGSSASSRGFNGQFLTIIPQFGLVLIGVVVATRRPENPISWLYFGGPLVFAMDGFAYGYAYYGTIAHPGSLPLTQAALLWLYWLGRALSTYTGMLLYLLFPTGRPLSPGWALIGWIGTGAVIAYMVSATIAPMSIRLLSYPFPEDLIKVPDPMRGFVFPLTLIFFSISLLCSLAALLSLFVRLYRSRGVERQQLKWFVYASSLFIPTIIFLSLGLLPGSPAPDWVIVLGGLFAGIMILSTGIASAFAILRYRLWDIDIIIRRTLIYGILTAVLVALYFAMVSLLQALVATVSGQDSPLVIVLSTLIIAALFTPLRRRIQEIIDRRFYRRKYDAEEILSRFSAAAQEEVDPGPLSDELLRVVDQTLQPERVILWLKEY
ncbi:MAG: hypothetical protein R3335_11135 [Anaerolineales bacterium]|nr:hypothetical protein [Anaerolineales bacterium]